MSSRTYPPRHRANLGPPGSALRHGTRATRRAARHQRRRDMSLITIGGLAVVLGLGDGTLMPSRCGRHRPYGQTARSRPGQGERAVLSVSYSAWSSASRAASRIRRSQYHISPITGSSGGSVSVNSPAARSSTASRSRMGTVRIFVGELVIAFS